MNFYKILAAAVLTTSLGLLVWQSPTIAADKAQAVQKKNKKALDKNTPVVDPKAIELKPQKPENPSNPSPVLEVSKLIDQEINKKLKEAKLIPSPQADDAEFLRRAYLDITGVIPSASKTREFLESKEPNKRAKLIDELIDSKGFGNRLGDIWANLMYPQDSDNRLTPKAPIREWMAKSFNEGKHWDVMTWELITATGEAEKVPEVTYIMANKGVDKLTDSVGKLFLGVQIQCAQCHNHPFTHWKQTEYWGLAQFFYKVDIQAARNGNQVANITPGVSELNRPGRSRNNPLPESAKNVPAKLLGAETVKMPPTEPYRPVLATWMTRPDNPFLAKAMVNRLWWQYFGRGLVNPVDDMSDENTPSHPELLAALTKEFVKSGFDVKHMVRCLTNSEAYQRTSKPNESNKDDNELYSHQNIKVLTGEQLYDSLVSITGGDNDRPMAKGAVRGLPNSPRDRFAQFFLGTDNALPTDYEAGIPQALRLMNGPMLSQQRMVSASQRIVGKKTSPSEVVDALYLATLNRHPSDEEMKKVTTFLSKANDTRSAYADILWTLLNTAEFTLNR